MLKACSAMSVARGLSGSDPFNKLLEPVKLSNQLQSDMNSKNMFIEGFDSLSHSRRSQHIGSYPLMFCRKSKPLIRLIS